MNQTQKDILERRSCRKYKPDAVPEELVQAIVDAVSGPPRPETSRRSRSCG